MGGWVSGERGEKEEGRLDHKELPAKVAGNNGADPVPAVVVGTRTRSADGKCLPVYPQLPPRAQALFWPFHGSTFLILTIIPGDRF